MVNSCGFWQCESNEWRIITAESLLNIGHIKALGRGLLAGVVSDEQSAGDSMLQPELNGSQVVPGDQHKVVCGGAVQLERA